MITCIGEILVDIIETKVDNEKVLKRFAGGAPFNVCCDLQKLKANAKFIGNVGCDVMGKFLIDYCKKNSLDTSLINIDNNHNTTLAFVTLDEDGERDFCFYRKNTADYFIELSNLEEIIEKSKIIHFGSLMLSEEKGREVADEIIRLSRKYNKQISFDINYRFDIYENKNQAINIYNKYIKLVDIVKYSEDESMLFTNTNNINDAISALKNDKQLIFITLGKEGSVALYNNKIYKEKSIKVNCVDTTGAGDAFYAGALSVIVDNDLDDEIIQKALLKGNICGALTTTKNGAIDAFPSIDLINDYF